MALPLAPKRARKRRPERFRHPSIISSAVALALAGVIAMPGNAHAQGVFVTPRVDGRLTFTDNVNAQKNGQSDLIAEFSPGISVLRQGGRFVGNLNAQLRNVVHMNESDRSDSFLALNGHAQIEAVERTLFIDMNGFMGRNNRSELLGRAQGDTLNTSSANETRSFGVGPRVQFSIGADTVGMASYMMQWLDGGGGLASRQDATVNARLSNRNQLDRFGWGLDFSRSESDYGSGRVAANNKVEQEVARATVYAKLTPDFRLRGIVGHESNDYDVASGESSSIVGGGFDWNPTERTTITGTTEKRVFGRGLDFRFNHRHALSSWNLSYSRAISSSIEAAGIDVFSDPEFRGLYDALESLIPDPLLREALVRRLLGFPQIGPRDAFFTNVHFVTRSLAGSMSLIGARNILSVVVQQSERTRLGPPVTNDPLDDFSRFDNVKTRSATVALTHRMAERTAINATLLRSQSEGSGGGRSNGETRRLVLNLGLSKQFTSKASGALTYSHQRAEGQANFNENVLTASLSMSF